MYFQSKLIVLCSLASVAFAAMSQGAQPSTAEPKISVTPSVESVFSQKGPRIHVFCGGITKNSTGGWTRGQPVFDHTPEAAKEIQVKIKGQPMGKTACLKFKKKHSPIVC